MVRRSGVAGADGGTESAVYGDEPPSWPGTDLRGASGDRAARPARVPWSGSGGRWMIWPMRIVLWAAILIIGYRGVMAIIMNETPATSSGTALPAPSATSQFPVTLAEAYALQFGHAFLNFSPGAAAQRQQELAAFVPASLAQAQPQLGWNGTGTMTLESEQVAGIDVQSAQSAVVTLLATVNGRMMELGVPIYSSGGGIVVSGVPAWLPAPLTIQPPNAQQAVSTDSAAQSALSSQLPAFFEAYASGDTTTLNRFLAPGTSLTGLGGAVTFAGITNMVVPAGSATRHIIVTVNWQLAGQQGISAAQLAATYDMVVVDQQSGKWYVKEIRASTQPLGNQ